MVVSNGRLAADLGVDKSVVGRWLSGSVSPSTYNLSRLTQYLAIQLPGFTLHDWERPYSEFRGRLMPGEPAIEPPVRSGDIGQARAQSLVEVEREGSAYPGMYAHFRMAFRNTGEVLVELLIIWREGERLLFRSFDPSFSHTGEVFIVRHQLFFVGEDDARADGLMCMIANGVSGQKAYRTDGIALGVAGDRHRTPGACMIVMQRIADLADEETVPPREVLVAICGRMKAAFADGRTGDIAGPLIRAVIRPVVGQRNATGGLDHFLRAPMDRSVAASEVELSRELVEELHRVRDAFVREGEAPAVSVAFDFLSPQLTDRESA